jgi:hypothetical protein
MNILAVMSGDRKGKPREFTPLSFDECKALSGYSLVFWYHTNKVHRVKITSVKTWKRRPEIEVHYKHGMFDYGIVKMNPYSSDVTSGLVFVKEAE